MRKLVLTTLLCVVVNLFIYSQNYVVQVAAFDTQVSIDYFKGLNGIYHVKDHNDIHRYYIGGFDAQADAENTVVQAKGNGYKYARAIDMDAIQDMCSNSCGAPVLPPDPSKIRSIFFDFDMSFLRGESKRQLDQLIVILNQNAGYSVELSAHTDAKGSLEYNTALSERRASSAKKYLLSKGIPADRIKESTFGEHSPIAKNELENGQDTEEGRQFNRRVELIVHDNKGAIASVVEKIEVPETLQEK